MSNEILTDEPAREDLVRELEFPIEERTRTVYIGENGAEFDTEAEALWSYIRALLVDVLDENTDIRESDLGEVADALRRNKANVIRWLRML